ncbi:hypothetical protein N9R43_00785 [bacterium]|nr:hypothetical protein [bacterium]
MAFKTSSIDLNVPAKVLPCTITSATALDSWPHDDGRGDPWWRGADNPKAYRWEIEMTVTATAHGSHLTRTNKMFNGYDVVVGDFIGGATDGKALQITSISEKTAFTVVCTVEDNLRYNTFRSASGSGIFAVPGQGVIFQINENGHPMLDPLPTGIVSSDFYANVNSRFQYLNPQLNVIMKQTANGFEEGDVVCLNDVTGEFEISSPDNIDRLVGTVVHPGPGPNQFMLRPANGVIDFVPGLPGSIGDFIYPSVDGSGDLTTTNTGIPIFMQLTNATPSIVRGDITDGSATAGDVIEINGVDVMFTTSSLGEVQVPNAATDINSSFALHKVQAEASPAPNSATSDMATYGSAYGLIGGFPPFAATFNGSVVNFSTTIAGEAAYNQSVAIADDMAVDINAAEIPNISARALNGILTIVHDLGQEINIGNETNDPSGNPFAGMNSISSINTTNPGQTGSYVLQLTRADGGEVIIKDKTGSPTFDFGLTSGHNGAYALGLNVEQGLRKAGNFVVRTLAERAGLPNIMIGDQVYVLDTGEGEWGLYIWDEAIWTLIATQDSAATDANSLSETFTMPITDFGTAKTVTLGRISDNSRIVSVLVEIVTPMSGYSGGIPSLEVGTQNEPSRFMSDYENDLESGGSYTTTPDFHYVGSAELEIKANLEHFGATSGEIKVTVTYV